jgi:hypothetical protein
LTTGLEPAMTLGCGGYGGNITSDNISPRHLLNIKRLAYEITPAVSRFEPPAAGAVTRANPLPSKGISAETLNRRIDDFLNARGYRAEAGAATPAPKPVSAAGASSKGADLPVAREATDRALDFVCEEDVRRALQDGRKLVVSERAIITPAARELAETHRVFSPPASKG